MNEALSVRISAELKARLEEATDQVRHPYAPSRAKLVERGIELALKELERRRCM